MAGSTVSDVAQKLGNILVEEVTFLSRVHDQVEWLERQLRWMEAFLTDADAKRRGHGVAYWVQQVREVAFHAENIVESYILKTHRHRTRSFLKRYASIFRELPVRHSIGMQIEAMKTRLREINEHMQMYGIDHIDHIAGGIYETSWADKTVLKERRESIGEEMSDVVYFKGHMENINKQLFDEEKKKRSVISIVGMGGLGKSVIVRRICNDKRVREWFGDRCALVTVSHSYTVDEVLKDIAKELGMVEQAVLEERGDHRKKIKESQNKDDREREIGEILPKFLEGGRYLIVLNDVWETKVWSDIQPYLPDNKNGSRVIITTRSMDVACSAAPSIGQHQLKPLSEKKSWDLFTKIVFPGEEVRKVCTGELEKWGKMIVKDCGGIPHVLAVMGVFLSMKERSVCVWRNVKEGIDWQETPEGEAYLKPLALRYEALPQHLKSCFLYFSCFPGGFVVDAEKLIQFWVAEGFVPNEENKQQRRARSRTMEETAEGWLEDLVQRSLVEVVEASPSGRVLKCCAQDLLLDLAIKLAEEVNFCYTCRINVEHVSPPTMARRLALHPPTRSKYKAEECSTPSLRTFLGTNLDLESLRFIKRLQFLRVLNLENCLFEKLPREIGNIILLRYLGLKGNRLRRIPFSIRKLRNLQTLDIRDNSLERLPHAVWEIQALRHVLLDNGVEIPIFRKYLVNLQTLEEAKAGYWIQKGLATLRNLRRLAITGILRAHHLDLAGSLDGLIYLRILKLAGDLLPRKALALKHHHHLEELILEGQLLGYEEDEPPNYHMGDLPPNLNLLRLHKSMLQQDPFQLLQNLQHLRHLVISTNAYVGDVEQVVCSAGGFPRLEQLLLNGLSITQWRVEEGAMPFLKRLSIHGCAQLEVPPQLEKYVTNMTELAKEEPTWPLVSIVKRSWRAITKQDG